jgi:hypothetical protein
MLVGFSDIAMAQKTTVQKTRYVYLWDVTGSIKPKKGKPLSASEGLYGRMYDYLHDDILSKPNGTEVVVIPFNDDVVDEYKFSVKKGVVSAKSGVNFDDLASTGIKLIEAHLENYNDKNKENGGYTDIAKSLDRVCKNYISDDYNTIFILLTDGGQEYVDGEVKTKGDEARKYLQERIESFDKAMCRASTINMLFYVTTVKDEFSPREREMSTKLTEFIPATESSAKLVFCSLVAELGAKKGVISCRDESFSINISAGDGVRLPKNMNFKVSYCGIDQNVEVEYGSAMVSCKNMFQLKNGEDLKVKLALEAGQKVEKEKSTYYIYWLETKSLDLTVTNNFTPRVTLRIK